MGKAWLAPASPGRGAGVGGAAGEWVTAVGIWVSIPVVLPEKLSDTP